MASDDVDYSALKWLFHVLIRMGNIEEHSHFVLYRRQEVIQVCNVMKVSKGRLGQWWE